MLRVQSIRRNPARVLALLGVTTAIGALTLVGIAYRRNHPRVLARQGPGGFQADAADRIADHINRFWAPRMRKLLLAYAAGGGQDLSAALLPALKKIRP